MCTKIHIPADDVWNFYESNKERLQSQMLQIAENENTRYAVYLTEENGYPLFSVCKGDAAPEYTEPAANKQDCAETAKRLFTRYLFPIVIDETGEHIAPEELSAQSRVDEDDAEDLIYEREDELELALYDFLSVVFGEDIRDLYPDRDMAQDILDYYLEYLGLELGLPVYRPMFVQLDNGEEEYVEFPYEDEFDDGLDDYGWEEPDGSEEARVM